MSWQPIDTAPKDRAILVFSPTIPSAEYQINVAYWDDQRDYKNPKPFWSFRSVFGVGYFRLHQPTHWMPLPAPPNSEDAG